MDQKYYVLLTKVGQGRLSEVISAEINSIMSYILLGDGGEDEGKETNPTEDDTALKRSRAKLPINRVYQHEKKKIK
ncbi:hypothetical protein B9G39_27715 [Zooshikella ganghwensis]|uniref:Phage tail fibre protein N-terminal domain-containing protein n=1 Tax=Zooshikella ganghwensis TaxID=202772 RepID=A0A4P9VGQ8_9GAMM|nr:phage tail protein [Zooshikella ganghwensis]RDH41539.1 hypothetical protein B9G39_27715 [Zooshikella ganghwensis]